MTAILKVDICSDISRKVSRYYRFCDAQELLGFREKDMKSFRNFKATSYAVEFEHRTSWG